MNTSDTTILISVQRARRLLGLAASLLLAGSLHAEVEVFNEVSTLPVEAQADYDGAEAARARVIYNRCAPTSMLTDSASLPVDTARLHAAADSIGQQAAKGTAKQLKAQLKPFVPNPQRALWLSLVFPGAGQIYNRKYWKLPIFYGGFLGCTYALLWNQQMYKDYSQAYLDIMDDDPRTASYLDMLPPNYDITGREEQFKRIFKRKKDFYRRYRDLSAFCFVGVYLLSVVDAYVDAQLSEFDISPDLSMRVHPSVITQESTLGSHRRAAYGVGCSLSF